MGRVKFRETNRKVDNFATLLAKSDKSRAGDKLTFECLKKGHITIDEAWEQFLENNHHYQDDYAWDEETKVRFVHWLRGLGYNIRLIG